MKKVFSFILSITIIFSTATINVYAFQNDYYGGIDISDYTNNELDLSEYTMEDILNMSSEEFLTLVKDFERIYDPFNSYTEQENIFNPENTVSPLWTSGNVDDGELTEIGCHEYITSIACSILINDKGFFSNDDATSVAIALLISLASLLPDKDEYLDGGYFAAHFYNPNTGKNYLRLSSPTAKTRAVGHFNTATTAASNGDMNTAYEYIGRCLHYIQDANEPHHAANVTSAGPLSSHWQFEHYAFENMQTYIGSYNTISNSYYTTANNFSVYTLSHDAAVLANAKIENVNSILDKTQWGNTARECLQNAARYSAMVLYKFSRANSVPFYSN